MPSIKQTAHDVIDHLPEQASWDDLMYELYVRKKIDAGLKAVEQGRTLAHDQVKARVMSRTVKPQ